MGKKGGARCGQSRLRSAQRLGGLRGGRSQEARGAGLGGRASVGCRRIDGRCIRSWPAFVGRREEASCDPRAYRRCPEGAKGEARAGRAFRSCGIFRSRALQCRSDRCGESLIRYPGEGEGAAIEGKAVVTPAFTLVL